MQMSSTARKGDDDSSPKVMREILQKKFLDEVVGCAECWKVMVIDAKATRVISSALTMFDIMEKKVTLVEQLNLNRQPFPQMDVVYLAEPTLASVKKISSDFESKAKAKYGNVHIFFIDTLSPELFSVIQNNSLLVSKVKTFKEISADFLAPENSVYHFDCNETLSKLYGALPDPSYPTLLGKKLANLCISLNEHPCIRYQLSSAYAKEIASTLHQALMSYKRSNPKFWCHGEDGHTDRDRSQILILDRSFDPLTPLMHEYTYQCMVNDLLDCEEGVVSYETTTNRGTKEEKKAVLNENDEFWIELRHLHIAKVIESIKDRMDDIIQNNSTLANKDGKGIAGKDISSMAAAIKKLPEYTQTMTKLGQHVSLAQQCMNAFSKCKLMDVSQVEQTITTGVDEDGNEVKKTKLLQMVTDSLRTLSHDEKIRLLCIYYICQKEGEDYALQAMQALNPTDKQTIRNLDKLLQPTLAERRVSEKKSQTSMFSSIFRGKAVKHASTPEGEYADTRHVCQLKTHLDGFVAGTLSNDTFGAMGPAISNSNKASEAKSVRKFGANSRWAKKDNTTFIGGRYIMFVAGGLTYAEMRVGYETMSTTNKEVIVGGSHIMSPNQYIADLANLGR